MKTIVIILSILTISQSTNAATCKDYITDEWPNSRYSIETISADNVVTDNKTELMWKQCSEGLTDSSCSAGSITTHTWQQALDLASTEDFAGFTDWRVPNRKELHSIVARNCYNPSINETVFPSSPSSWFWTSSPNTDANEVTNVVDFDKGFDYGSNRIINRPVRLVRSFEL